MRMMTHAQTAKSVKSRDVNKIYRGTDAVKYIKPQMTGRWATGLTPNLEGPGRVTAGEPRSLVTGGLGILSGDATLGSVLPSAFSVS